MNGGTFSLRLGYVFPVEVFYLPCLYSFTFTFNGLVCRIPDVKLCGVEGRMGEGTAVLNYWLYGDG